MKNYDVAIVGGGVAGLSAAIFTGKAGLSTVIFDKNKSQITRVSSVQNIPGFSEGISGKEWIKKAKNQVEKFNGEILNELVTEAVKQEDGTFEIKTDKATYTAKYLIIATNTEKDLISTFNLEVVTNRFVPSGKSKSVPNIPWNGETEVENLYLAGLINEIPSQVSVVLGQGAAVGISVASKAKEAPYMWHDV